VDERNGQMSKKVFISYAGEDVDFANDLATKLRAKGLDVWLAKWEILPGDDLVDQVFEKGLKDAHVVIVILSQASVDKPWVRAELNVAAVRRINGLTKLIPVVLDDCEIPEALRSTLYQRIKDQANYDDELEAITHSIFEFRDKPALGHPPAYAVSSIAAIPGLRKTDGLVLKLVGEHAFTTGTGEVDSETLLEKTRLEELSDKQVIESLEGLQRAAYLRISYVQNTSKPFRSVILTGYGIQIYAQNYIDGYSHLRKDVVHQIINLKQYDSTNISVALNKPILLVNHIVDTLASQKAFKTIRSHAGDYNRHIYQISSLLNRELD
jgi:hypothetical protein